MLENHPKSLILDDKVGNMSTDKFNRNIWGKIQDIYDHDEVWTIYYLRKGVASGLDNEEENAFTY